MIRIRKRVVMMTALCFLDMDRKEKPDVCVGLFVC